MYLLLTLSFNEMHQDQHNKWQSSLVINFSIASSMLTFRQLNVLDNIENNRLTCLIQNQTFISLSQDQLLALKFSHHLVSQTVWMGDKITEKRLWLLNAAQNQTSFSKGGICRQKTGYFIEGVMMFQCNTCLSPQSLCSSFVAQLLLKHLARLVFGFTSPFFRCFILLINVVTQHRSVIHRLKLKLNVSPPSELATNKCFGFI